MQNRVPLLLIAPPYIPQIRRTFCENFYGQQQRHHLGSSGTAW
jgi:hypothetical protein